jgi:hypothetical protein
MSPPLLLLVLLLAATAAASTADSSVSVMPGCQQRCGGVGIPSLLEMLFFLCVETQQGYNRNRQENEFCRSPDRQIPSGIK